MQLKMITLAGRRRRRDQETPWWIDLPSQKRIRGKYQIRDILIVEVEMPSEKQIKGRDRSRNTLLGGVEDAFSKANKSKTLTKELFDYSGV